MELMDFTSCPRVLNRAYNGANGKKIAVSYKDEVWILKFPNDVRERPNEQSYSNSSFSEYVGCTIYNLLGIPVQETKLGTFVNGRTKVVCACKDFTKPGLRLFDFCSIKNTVLESGSGGTGTELNDVLEAIDQQQFMDSFMVRRRFWQMFVVDALLGNFDRHNGNWGFLVDENTGDAKLAPVFDCGSCLLSQADDNIMQKCLDNQDEMLARVYSFPSSMLKIDGRKIHYYDFLKAYREEDFTIVLNELTPKIMELDFDGIISDTPYMAELHREFLLRYLNVRREKLFVRND